MSKWTPDSWQCECCEPPRRIYWQSWGAKIEFPYHEDDDTLAKPHITERSRISREGM